jgi:hypothetical protein
MAAALMASLAAAASVPLGTPDPALARLFTPLSVPAGTYLVYRSSDAIETLTARLRALDPAPAPGAWEPTRPEARGAFGEEGRYDRDRLARLFNGKRVTLVRGSLVHQGRRVAYTLVSPYPDATLSRIMEGTMVIEFRVPPLE